MGSFDMKELFETHLPLPYGDPRRLRYALRKPTSKTLIVIQSRTNDTLLLIGSSTIDGNDS
jgi:hypothetical protein